MQNSDLNNYDFQFADRVESFILDANKVEDNFEVGDALLQDKFVWHKSCSLKEGVLPSRMAYVMRFLDRQARYSRVFIEGTYSLLSSNTKDLDSDIGYQLANFLKDGDTIADNLASLKKS